MTVQTLAEAALLVRPDLTKATVGVEAAGEKAGQQYGSGFKRGADGRLRDAHGKFVNDSGKAGEKAGGRMASGYSKKAKSGILGGLKDVSKSAAAFLIPAGIGAAVAEIGKIGMTYENNLNVFQAVTKATGAQMDQVAGKARALGADVKLPGVSAAGAAEAMTQLSKSGFSVQQSMDAARGTLQLARAATISEGAAAEITGNAINAFGLKADQASFVVDELAASANSSSVEITDVSAAFKMAAAVFSSFQGPAVGSEEAITELNTAIAILGNNGIKGSDAGTSLKQMLLQLSGPTLQAQDQMTLLAQRAAGATATLKEQSDVLHGSKAVREAALASIAKHNKGIQAEGNIAYDASGKMRSLREIIDLTAKGTAGLSQQERDYAITQIFGADASRSVIALMKGGLPVYDAQRKAVMQVGAASDVAAAKNKGLSGAIDNVRSQLENAAIGIYNAIKGPLTKGLNDLAKDLSGVFGFIGTHADEFKALAKIVLGTAVVWGTYSLAVKAATAATIAWAGIQAAIAWVQLLASVRTFRDLWAAVNLVMDANPIGAVVVAIAALVAGVIYAYKHWAWFRQAVDAAWKGIKIAISATVDWIVKYVWPVLQAAWKGIAAGAKWMWENVIQPAVHAMTWYFQNVIAPAALWLWHHVLEPAWKGISWAVQTAIAVVRLNITAMVTAGKGLARAAQWLWHTILEPVWKGISWVVKTAVAALKLELAGLIKFFQYTLGPTFTFLWHKVVVPTFNAIRSAVSAAWDFIKPILSKLGDFVTKTLVDDFKLAVKTIKTVWEGMKNAALTPVRFVVNAVINPLIGGFNKLAKTFGTPQIEKIPGFDQGGQIPGSPSAKDNRWAWLRDSHGNVLGKAGLATGEFVVNARDTAKALPLLRWINDGMRGGAAEIRRRIGRPLTDMPGDGSTGWGFDKGGLVGFLSDVWGAISNPSKLIKAPLEGALDKIPGGGYIRDMLLGMGHKLIGGLTSFITGGSTGAAAGSVGKAQAFLRAQNGKPYVWASAGPSGYDCSGIVSAVYNILHGKNPYHHTFSTETAGSFFPKPGPGGPLVAGWSHPGQSPASATIGHMAGNLAGLAFESSGSRGVHLGASARQVGEFAQVGHFAHGGMVRLAKIAKADFGAVTLAPGHNLVYNGTGAPEPLQRPDLGGGLHLHFHNSVITGKQQVEDMFVTAYISAKKKKRIP